MSSWSYPTGLVALVLLLWQFSVQWFDVPVYLLPTPTAIGTRILSDFPYLFHHARMTILVAVGGFALAVAIALPLAVALVWSKVLAKACLPLILMTQSFPKIALAPLIAIWFGLGLVPKILVSFLISFFPILMCAISGMRFVDKDLVALARAMQASEARIFYKIRLPHAVPSILSGCKVAAALSVVGAVVAEWVGASAGLGYLLLRANANLDTVLLFSALVFLMLIGVVLYLSVTLAEHVLLPWHRSLEQSGAFETL